MYLRSQVKFHSAKFPAYPNEEEKVNPNLWGKRLAEYIRGKLESEGIKTGEIYSEDWGWAVPVEHPLVSVWIGCGHDQEYIDGYFVFIEPSKPIVKKYFFKKIDMSAVIIRLADVLDKVLSSDPEIHGLCWYNKDEN
ncbi:MAG: hypothetical protein LBV66_02600 [Elusimicrobiota bacterium]|jgi:hypothetical protein|nr:hypothetical protein [Elusimicrobiota bacterium]